MHLNASYSLLERFSGGFLAHTVGTIFKILAKCPCTYRDTYDIGRSNLYNFQKFDFMSKIFSQDGRN